MTTTSRRSRRPQRLAGRNHLGGRPGGQRRDDQRAEQNRSFMRASIIRRRADDRLTSAYNPCVFMLMVWLLWPTAQSVRAMLDRAMDDFRAGRIEQSLAGFDRVALLSPAEAPFLWQRGIAQYYAGKFRDCRDMFISHRTVNPDDVENAAGISCAWPGRNRQRRRASRSCRSAPMRACRCARSIRCSRAG